jgi:hypothetical protein
MFFVWTLTRLRFRQSVDRKPARVAPPAARSFPTHAGKHGCDCRNRIQHVLGRRTAVHTTYVCAAATGHVGGVR